MTKEEKKAVPDPPIREWIASEFGASFVKALPDCPTAQDTIELVRMIHGALKGDEYKLPWKPKGKKQRQKLRGLIEHI